MIIGNLNDTESIEKLHPLYKAAFAWIRNNYKAVHRSGMKRVVIDGDSLFANIDNPVMKLESEQVMEVHRRYIDIHIPVDKDETIGWSPVYGLEEEIEPYDSSLDRAFFGDTPVQYFVVKPGEFAIMYPHDAHAPIIGEGSIKKICMKVAVE